MKITFISLFLNHHQLPLCFELQSKFDEFIFVATQGTPGFRIKLGYEDVNKKYPFVMRAYEPDFDESRVYDLLDTSDAVIFGDCPGKYIEYRMEKNKLSFLYSERFFKRGTWHRFIPQTRAKVNKRIARYSDKPMYVLCASAFLSYDLSLLGFPEDKCRRWGYFPEVKKYDDLMANKHEKCPTILWAGRLKTWKHPEDAVKACATIRKKGCDFSLEIIGTGDCDKALKGLADGLGLSDCVSFTGSMPYQQVREHMESADIFVLTSGFQEGWGAVVNEAMNSGCAVLASSAAGSVPFLIEDGKSGLVYRFGSSKQLEQKLMQLVTDSELRHTLAKNAYDRISGQYTVQTAVDRLKELILLGNSAPVYSDGAPMSEAKIMKKDWYKR